MHHNILMLNGPCGKSGRRVKGDSQCEADVGGCSLGVSVKGWHASERKKVVRALLLLSCAPSPLPKLT